MVMNLNKGWTIIAVVPTGGQVRETLIGKDIPVRTIYLPPIRPWFLGDMVICIEKIRNLCLSSEAALVYCNGSRAAFYGGLAGRFCRIPAVWHCRVADMDPLLDPILVRLCSHIIANSQATAKRFARHDKDQVTVVYNGFDIDWLQQKSVDRPVSVEPDWRVIIIVSRVSRWKHHDIALAAFEKIARSDEKTHLFCVGAKDPNDIDWLEYLQTMK